MIGISQTGSLVRSVTALNSFKNVWLLVYAPVSLFPSALTIEPVNVATSMTRSAPSFWANHSASAKVKRPSASVDMTSIVLPLAAVSISSGTIASFPIRLSVAATMVITLALSSRRAIPSIAETTAAAPAISTFIPGILVGVFNEYPPVSYITPFPTRAVYGDFPSLLYLIAINLGSSVDPLLTPKYAPIFISSMACLSYTSTVTFSYLSNPLA